MELRSCSRRWYKRGECQWTLIQLILSVYSTIAHVFSTRLERPSYISSVCTTDCRSAVVTRELTDAPWGRMMELLSTSLTIRQSALLHSMEYLKEKKRRTDHRLPYSNRKRHQSPLLCFPFRVSCSWQYITEERNSRPGSCLHSCQPPK